MILSNLHSTRHRFMHHQVHNNVVVVIFIHFVYMNLLTICPAPLAQYLIISQTFDGCGF